MSFGFAARSRKPPATAEARQRALWLCREETGLTLREIGQLFGGIHSTAVNQNIRRLKAATNDKELNEWRRCLLQATDSQ